MRAVVTGAAGRIGSEVIAELSGSHGLHLVDRVAVAGRRSTVADLSRYREQSRWLPGPGPRPRWWRDAFDGADVVIHLAATIPPRALWPAVLRDNVRATWNVLQAAARYGVPRVVFASSHWAVKALEQELAPACYTSMGPKIGSDAPPRPLSAYGISKALGEIAGRALIDEHRLVSFLAVRIGSYKVSAPATEDQRRRWITPIDLRSFFRRCIEADCEGFHVLYAVGDAADSPYDLSHTSRLLSWTPVRP